MKFITILFSLFIFWLALISINFARDNWVEKGSFMPMLAGLLFLFYSFYLFIRTIRKWWQGSFREQDRQYHIN